MKDPKFRIWSKVKVEDDSYYWIVTGIQNKYRGNDKYDIVYYISGRVNYEWEQYVKTPTDYELGTYY